MQLITLNIWGGHVRNPLLSFIESYQNTDIFCLQEIYHRADKKVSNEDRQVYLNIFAEIHALLPEHQAFFKPTVNNNYGLGMFVKKGIGVIDEGEIEIHHNPNYSGLGPTHSRKLQWLKCHAHNKEYAVMNVHGLWNGDGKTDTPARIEQSSRIKNFTDSFTIPKILCGDFNLRPDTQSIKILEQGMENLIQRYNVCSTRTSLYPKEEKFADYIFTSPDITINTFQVLEDEVSDHAPLLIDFF